MKSLHKAVRLVSLLTMLAAGATTGVAHAADLRGTVSSVDANGQVRIDLPQGSSVKLGDAVRLETVVPGVGPVEIKSRWSVKSVGNGFILAAPVGQASATPKAGYTAIVTTASGTPAAATAAPSSAATATAPTPPAKAGTTKAGDPALKLTAEQMTGIKKQADGGDTRAMRLLALYHNGKADSSDRVPRRQDEAIIWYEKAAKSGDAGAMTSLGFIYLTKRKDDAKAFEWFGKAADKGNAVAMSMLARLYEQGRGVPKDEAKSFEWAKKAADKADDNGATAYDLAQMYFAGAGTRQDFVEAAHWYRKSAEKGFTPAMIKLAQIYTAGMGLAQDPARGLEWARQAAEAGSPVAMYQVGTHHLLGNGSPPDPLKAKQWYEKAANAGEAEAMFGLSYIYDKGLGVTANPGMAADWMVLAIREKSFQAAESVMHTPWKWTETFRREFQKRLLEAGVYQGKIDGDIGSGSRRAIVELTRIAVSQ